MPRPRGTAPIPASPMPRPRGTDPVPAGPILRPRGTDSIPAGTGYHFWRFFTIIQIMIPKEE